VRTWNYGDRRYTRDWRSYGDTRVGTAVRRYRYEDRMPTRTYETSTRYRTVETRDQGDWRDGRQVRERGNSGHGHDQGQGRGRGQGNGHGHGRGHGHGDD
jgi:hypothetical protein